MSVGTPRDGKPRKTPAMRKRDYPRIAILDSQGSASMGSDTSRPATTSIKIFKIDMTWNGEAFHAGDILIGDNSTSKANFKFDYTVGAWYFRSGTTTNVGIDIAGNITFLSEAVSSTGYLQWKTAAGVLTGWIDNALGAMTIEANADTVAHQGIIALNAANYLGVGGALTLYDSGTLMAKGTDGVHAPVGRLYSWFSGGGGFVQNSVVETTLWTRTIKANQLGTDGSFSFEGSGSIQQNSAGIDHLNIRVKFGGLLFAKLDVGPTPFAGTGGFYFRGRIGNNAATNLQRGGAMISASKNGVWDGTSCDSINSGNIDTTVNQDLVITAQWGIADPNAGVFADTIYVETYRANTSE